MFQSKNDKDSTTITNDRTKNDDTSKSKKDRNGSITGSAKTTDDELSVNSIDTTPTPSVLKVLSLASPEYPMFLVAVVLMIIGESIGMYTPLLLGKTYDFLIDPTIDQSRRMPQVNKSMAFILILHGIGCLTSFLYVGILQIIGERVVARVRSNMYVSIMKQEISFFDKHQSGELISRLSSDTSLIQHGTSQSLPEVSIGTIKVIVALGIMFSISPKLAGVMLGFVGFVMFLAVPFGVLLSQLSKRYQNVLGDATGYTAEALQSMRTVQSFGSEMHEHIRYLSKIGNPMEYRFWYPTKSKMSATTSSATSTSTTSSNDDDTTYRIGFFKGIVTSAFYTVIFGAGFAGMYFCLWYGFNLVTLNEITIGDLTAFQSYIFVIGGSLGQTASEFSQLIEAQGVAGRIFYLLNRIPLIPTPLLSNNNKNNGSNPDPTTPKASSSKKSDVVDISILKNDVEAGTDNDGSLLIQQTPPDDVNGEITFNDVTFAYPSRPGINVLQNFTLNVPPNQTTALVGASGSGKSTCISLLQRFYDVSHGSILMDGKYDIRTVDIHWLRKQMAYVQQEPQLFGISVRDNILYGVADKEKVTEDELIEITTKANAHEFIMKWPKGYDTLVGERGVKLSGGQKQRIAIARALMRKPKILLLDEATSALDAESEHLVQQAIDNATLGRTVVIVAHRLSTIQRASQIVVVDEHRIIDVGSHNDLLVRCTKYQDLIKRQALLAGSSTVSTTGNLDNTTGSTSIGTSKGHFADI